MKIYLESLAIFSFLFLQPKKSLAIFAANFWIFQNFRNILRKNSEIEKLKKVEDEKIMKTMIGKSIVFSHFIRKKKIFEITQFLGLSGPMIGYDYQFQFLATHGLRFHDSRFGIRIFTVDVTFQ